MWLALVALAYGGPADDFGGTWCLDKARSDSTDRAMAGLAPMAPPGGVGGPSGAFGGPPRGTGGGPPGGTGEGPAGGMGGAPAGGDESAPGDMGRGDRPKGTAGGASVLLPAMLIQGSFCVAIASAGDALSVAWVGRPPIELVIDGPVLKTKVPGGRLRASARTTPFGVALERRVGEAVLTETLFREGDDLVIAVEAKAPGRPTEFVRRVYRRSDAGPASARAPASPPAP